MSAKYIESSEISRETVVATFRGMELAEQQRMLQLMAHEHISGWEEEYETDSGVSGSETRGNYRSFTFESNQREIRGNQYGGEGGERGDVGGKGSRARKARKETGEKGARKERGGGVGGDVWWK